MVPMANAEPGQSQEPRTLCQVPEPSSAAFADHQGAESEMEQVGLEPALQHGVLSLQMAA